MWNNKKTKIKILLHVSRVTLKNNSANIDISLSKPFSCFSNSFFWKVIYLYLLPNSYNCMDGCCCCYIVPKDNRSFIAAVNSRACTVGNIAPGNNQFVVTLENFISTRRQKAGARKVAPLNVLL